MKKIITTLLTIFILFSSGFTQQIENQKPDKDKQAKILEEYKAVQQQLDVLSLQWQKEIQEKYQAIDLLYKSKEEDQGVLTDKMKKRREKEITKKEKEVKDLQQHYFGIGGELSKKKSELLKPLQDKLNNGNKKG